MKSSCIRTVLTTAVLGLAGLTQACGTLQTTATGMEYVATGNGAPLALPYAGTLGSTVCFLVASGDRDSNNLWVLDIPLSFAADTALLPTMPYMIGAQGLRYGYDRVTTDSPFEVERAQSVD